MKTKLRKIGSGYGVLLPKKVIDNLRLSVGDELELTEEEWGIELSPFDPDFANQVEAFRADGGAAPEQLSGVKEVLIRTGRSFLRGFTGCGKSPKCSRLAD